MDYSKKRHAQLCQLINRLKSKYNLHLQPFEKTDQMKAFLLVEKLKAKVSYQPVTWRS